MMAEGPTTNIRISGVDMTVGEMTVLFLKIAIALLPVYFLFMFIWFVFATLVMRRALP